MTAVEESILIRAPIGPVFTALTDPRRSVEWNPSIVELGDVSGPVREGTIWRQTVMMMGRPMKLNCRVERYFPPQEGVIAISGDQRGQVWTRCVPSPEGTWVTQGIDFEPPGGMLGRLMSGAIAPAIKRELVQTMRRQKEVLEGESGGFRPG